MSFANIIFLIFGFAIGWLIGWTVGFVIGKIKIRKNK